MKHIDLIAAAALVLAATPAFAANWVYITSVKSGTFHYYDADTIRRSGNYVTVWEKRDHSFDKTVKARETKTQIRFNCAERTLTVLDFTKYYPDGKTETTTVPRYQHEVQSVIPDTIGETILKAVCAATASQ